MAQTAQRTNGNGAASANASRDELLQFYRDMLLIRRFEERAGQLYGMGLIGGFCHLYIGQEALVVGLQAALKSGRGVMLFINHLGNMACIVGGLAIRGYDVTLAGNRIWIPFIERKLERIHKRVGAKRVHLGGQLASTASRVFRRNGIFATFIDFSVTLKHNAWLEFGHAEMSVSLAPAILAIRNNVDVICASCIRMGGNSHRVIIHPPLTAPKSGELLTDAGALMQDAMRLLHADMLRQPEQWWSWDKVHLRLRQRILVDATGARMAEEQPQT